MIEEPSPVTLNATTFVAITVPGTGTGLLDSLLFTEDLSPFIYATDEAGTNPVTQPAGSMNIPRVNKGKILMWVKAFSGTPRLILQLARS